MKDEELTAIWHEHFGPVYRPKEALPLLRAVADAAAAEEREACVRACDNCACEARDLDHAYERMLGCVACAAAIRSMRADNTRPERGGVGIRGI